MTIYASLHFLLDHERLLFHCDEWRTTNHSLHIDRPYSQSYFTIGDTANS
jgi:hypothetical protein